MNTTSIALQYKNLLQKRRLHSSQNSLIYPTMFSLFGFLIIFFLGNTFLKDDAFSTLLFFSGSVIFFFYFRFLFNSLLRITPEMHSFKTKHSNKVFNGELDEIFDFSCPVSKEILNNNKNELLLSYRKTGNLNMGVVFDLMSKIENEKESQEEMKSLYLESDIIAYAGTKNSNNIKNLLKL